MQQRWKMNRNWTLETKSKKLEIGCKNENGSVEEKKIDENFNKNWFSSTDFYFSEPFEHPKHQKYGRQQHGAIMVVRNPKIYWLFLHFSWTRKDHLT